MAGEVARFLGLNEMQASAAMDCDHDVLVSAGAGTGKTKVLTARYLTLLLERGYRPAQVAAITFTNKAASEMRERIRHGLAGLAGTFPAAAGMNEELNWAPIQTIHSFCGQLLRGDPIAAGVPPGFHVLEEGEAGLMLAEACEQALVAALTEPEREGLTEALLIFGRRRLLALVAQTYRAFCQWGLDSSQGTGEDGVAELLVSAGRAFIAWWEEFLAHPEPAGLAQGTKGVLQELRGMDEEVRLAVARVVSGGEDMLLNEMEGLLGRLKAGEFKNLGAMGRGRLLALIRAHTGVRAALIRPALLELVAVAAHEYETAKAGRSQLDFADLEVKARGLLEREAARRLLQERFPFLLIDEFQDTNPLQWAIVQSLRSGSHGCRLFAVGDVKQSIYRFRGADVRIMRNLRCELTTGAGRVYSLQENYRCHPALAALVNHVCGQLLSPEAPYEPLYPTRADELTAPHVEAMLVPVEALDRAAEAGFIANRVAEMLAAGHTIVDPDHRMPRPVKPGDIALLFRAATDISQYERALRAAGLPYRVLAGSGFYRRDEVAALLYLLAAVENSGDGIALAAALRSPLFGVGDAGLYRVAKDAGLVAGFASLDFTAPSFNEDGPKLARARTVFGSLRDRRHLLSLDQILAEAIEATDYRALQAAFPDYPQRLTNLDKLLRVARHYTSLGRGEAGEFLAYLEALEDLEVREGEASLAGGDDAILLLTVHRAKGLEFPVVILPDLGRATANRYPEVMVAEDGRVGFRLGPEKEGRASPIWSVLKSADVEQGEAEAKRLLYVALTRARDHLMLVGSGPRKEGTWLSWLRATLPIPENGDEVQYPGGRIRLLRREEPAHPVRASRALASLHPGIRRGEPLGLPLEAAAARETWPPLARLQPGLGLALTVSGALALRACPRRYYLRYLLDLPEPAGDGETDGSGGGPVLGSLVHKLALGMAMAGAEVGLAAEPVEPCALAAVNPATGPARLEDAALRRLLDNYRGCESYRSLTGAAGVWAEFEFHLAPAEGRRLIGTADLVWIDGTGAASVADLKTNRVTSPPEELLAEHAFQLQLYGLALQRLFGRVSDRGRLEYLWPGIGIDVPLDEAALAAVESELAGLFDFLAAHRDYSEYQPRQGEPCRWCWFKWEICQPPA